MQDNPPPHTPAVILYLSLYCLVTQSSLLRSHPTRGHVCRHTGGSINHKGQREGAALAQRLHGPRVAELLFTFLMNDAWLLWVWCGERGEWATAAREANEHWSSVLQLHWPQRIPPIAPRSGGNGLSWNICFSVSEFSVNQSKKSRVGIRNGA